MVVMAVADEDGVDDWYIGDGTGCRGVALGTEEREGRTSVIEDGVEEDAEPRRILNVVAGVAEPCGAELFAGGAAGEEVGFVDGDGGGCGVRGLELASESWPGADRAG